MYRAAAELVLGGSAVVPDNDMMRPVFAAAATALAVMFTLWAAPGAAADPDGAELDALNSVTSDTFYTYSTYGAGGWQFVTPDGVRCRIMTVTRWQSPYSVTCWGAALPGVTAGANYVSLLAARTLIDPTPVAEFGTGDLDSFETYRSYEHRSGDTVDRVDPASYHLLPSGSKLVVTTESTILSCGVPGAQMLVCTIDYLSAAQDRIGFVLSPNGSRTF